MGGNRDNAEWLEGSGTAAVAARYGNGSCAGGAVADDLEALADARPAAVTEILRTQREGWELAVVRAVGGAASNPREE